MKKFLVFVLVISLIGTGVYFFLENKYKVKKSDLENYFKERYKQDIVLEKEINNKDGKVLLEYNASLNSNKEIKFIIGKKLKDYPSPVLPELFSAEYYDTYSESVTKYLEAKNSKTIEIKDAYTIQESVEEIKKIFEKIKTERKEYGLSENITYTYKIHVKILYKEQIFEFDFGQYDMIYKLIENKIMMYELMR